MSEAKLHLKLKEFKQYVNERPELLKEIRRSGKPLQEYYERWHIESAGSEGNKKSVARELNGGELWTNALKYIEYIDVQRIQYHLKQFNELLKTVEWMMEGFTKSDDGYSASKQVKPLYDVFRD